MFLPQTSRETLFFTEQYGLKNNQYKSSILSPSLFLWLSWTFHIYDLKVLLVSDIITPKKQNSTCKHTVTQDGNDSNNFMPPCISSSPSGPGTLPQCKAPLLGFLVEVWKIQIAIRTWKKLWKLLADGGADPWLQTVAMLEHGYMTSQLFVCRKAMLLMLHTLLRWYCFRRTTFWF